MFIKSLTALTLAAGVLAQAQNTTVAVPRNSTVGLVAAPKPIGGLNNNTAPPPRYVPDSDYDYQSFLLAQFQEYIELDLFRYALYDYFSIEDFEAKGINADQRGLIEFMREQEVNHATLLGNILSGYPGGAAQSCSYRYNFVTIDDWIAFTAELTRWGESGVLGFLASINSRPIAQLLSQSIATESRQQMVFRQFAGASAMPVGFETGISQQMSWTLLSRYIIACPAGTPRINWNINPALNVINNKNLSVPGVQSAVNTYTTKFWNTNDRVELEYEQPGMMVSYNDSTPFMTAYGANVTQINNLTCNFIAQLNVTTTPFVSTGNNTGYCLFPNATTVYPNSYITTLNDTNFLLLTSENIAVTPYNISKLDDITVAGPAVVVFG